MEMFDGKGNLLNLKEDVIAVVTSTTNTLVLGCKRPKPKTQGGAMVVSKWCIKALTKPNGSAAKHPATILVKNIETGLTHSYRWRVEPGYFPHPGPMQLLPLHHRRVHLRVGQEEDGGHAGGARQVRDCEEGLEGGGDRQAKRVKDLANGKAAHGGARDKTEKMARMKQVFNIKPECKEAGLCAWYQVSCCTFSAEVCHSGKHIMLANVSYAASSGAGASSSAGVEAMD